MAGAPGRPGPAPVPRGDCAPSGSSSWKSSRSFPSDMVFFTQITMEAAEDPAFLAAMRRGPHQGRARRRRSGHARRAEGRLQGFQLRWRDAGRTAPGVQATHGVHVLGSFIFGLPSDRPADLRSDLRDRDARGRDVRAVRDADAVPRHGRFRRLGKDDGVGRDPDWRRAADPALADPAGAAAEGLHPASGHGSGRDSPPHTGGMGRFLQPAARSGSDRAACSR